MSIQPRQRTSLWAILAISGVLALVIACGVVVLVPRGAPVRAMAAVPPPEVEERAVQVAEIHYNGTVTTTTARAITQGQVAALRCSFIDRVQQQVAALMDGNQPPPWCNNNLPLWEFTLQGNFHDPDLGNVGTLQVIAAPDDNVQVVIAR